MTDVVVTVPMARWADWIDEGNLAGEPWDNERYEFTVGGPAPDIRPGERVYIVAHGKLRGYSPLIAVERRLHGFALIRGGNAVAVTITEPVRGFQGWRKRWWERSAEIPFPEWASVGQPGLVGV